MQLALSDYITVTQAAKLIGVTPRRVNQLCDSGELEFVRFSKRAKIITKASAKAYKKGRRK